MSVRQAPLASDVFNVKDFGAVGDGKQDDTQFIQKAINAAYNGGVVYFPFGVYNISSPLIVNADSVSLIGDGQRASAPIIQISPSADPTYALIVGNTKNVNSCLISGLAFIGKNSTTSTGKGILFRSNGGKMFQTKVSLFGGDGIDISAFSGQIFEVFLEDVELVQNGMNTITPGDNLMMDNTTSDCEFHRVLSSGNAARNTTRYGIYVNSGAYCKFVDCHAYWCNQFGLYTQGQGTQVIGGEWENNAQDGLVCSGIQAQIIGATFALNGNLDIAIFSGPTNIIGNMLISTAGFANIYANNAQGGIIAENTILGTPTGLQLDTGSSLYQVHDNNFSSTSANTILIKATNSDIHDNTVSGGGNIIEQTGAQGNNIHDNKLIGGGTITQIGTTTAIRNNAGFNPRGHSVTQPGVPATTVAATNTTGCDCTVLILGGTLTVVAIGGSATGITAAAPAGSVHSVRVPVGQTIAITYSVAPTWQWFGD